MADDNALTPTRRLLIGALFVAMAAGGFVVGRVALRPSNLVQQPIAFNHLKHAGEMELSCDTCHLYYETGEHSGLPTLDTCLDCHEEPVTESAEEKKILALQEEGRTNPFRKLFRLPDHVYYSHRRHVAIAGLDCEECHGKIAETEAPPRQPLKRITMSFCINCHEKSGAKSECAFCHR